MHDAVQQQQQSVDRRGQRLAANHSPEQPHAPPNLPRRILTPANQTPQVVVAHPHAPTAPNAPTIPHPLSPDDLGHETTMAVTASRVLAPAAFQPLRTVHADLLLSGFVCAGYAL